MKEFGIRGLAQEFSQNSGPVPRFPNSFREKGMDLLKSFRVVLIIGILLGGMAIVWNFLSRREEGFVIPEVEILSPDISRQTTQFEYTEHKRGRTVFTVHAETSTQTVSQVHTLENVTLAYYDESGTASDIISAQEAVYLLEDQQIEFNGDATIQLADGTEVFCEQVSADLIQERVVIEGNFRFLKGDIKGDGESLIYDFPQRKIQVEKGLHLMAASGSDDLEGRASQAVYILFEETVELIGDALISGGDTHLEADQITAFLTTESRIEKILSSGEARLQFASLKSLSGPQINVFFDPDLKRLEKIEALGEPQKSSGRAVYSEGAEGRDYFLEANRIEVVPDRAGTMEGLLLETFSARGDVLFRSPSLGIDESRSQEMEGQFFDNGEHLRQLDLRGQVSLRRGLDSQASVEEQLHSEVLTLRFRPEQDIEQAIASGNVDLRLNSLQGYRHLWARDAVEVNYLDGSPERIVSRGDSRIEKGSAGQRDVLEAPFIEIRYRQGLLDHMTAQGGVALQSSEGGKARNSTSQRLEVSYRDSEVERAVQSGDFHFWEGNPASIEVESDQAVFDPESNRVTMTGERTPVLRFIGADGSDGGSPVETTAQRLELDRRTGEISAVGRVRSFFPEEDGSTIITAGGMEAKPETGWITYSASPRITQQYNSITGKIVRYNHRDQQLVVEEEVTSFFIEGNQEDGKKYTVQADRLLYKRADLRARYEGQVRVKTDDLIVDAPFVEFVFLTADPDQLQEIVAWGGVKITGKDREAEGQRAVHFPLQEKVVLTGDPAQVTEALRGKVTGRQLTFFTGDDRLLIENPSTPEKP